MSAEDSGAVALAESNDSPPVMGEQTEANNGTHEAMILSLPSPDTPPPPDITTILGSTALTGPGPDKLPATTPYLPPPTPIEQIPSRTAAYGTRDQESRGIRKLKQAA